MKGGNGKVKERQDRKNEREKVSKLNGKNFHTYTRIHAHTLSPSLLFSLAAVPHIQRHVHGCRIL